MEPGGPNGISRRTLREQSSEPELTTGHVPGRETRKILEDGGRTTSCASCRLR
jgi:hypothetical protein